MKTIRFTIYPDDNKYYKFYVEIYPTLRGFARHSGSACMTKGLLKEYPGMHCTAFVEQWDKEVIHPTKGKPYITGSLGRIVFNAQELSMGTISHECAHAAFRYCISKKSTNFRKRVKVKGVPGKMAGDDEETFCYAQGNLVNQIVNKLIKIDYKIWPEEALG